MKVACTHCEKVADESVADSTWIEIRNPTTRFGYYSVGRFCGPGCAVSHLERIMGREPRIESFETPGPGITREQAKAYMRLHPELGSVFYEASS